jgi:spermidine synthase
MWWSVAALSGFGTLGLEVLYTRLFSLVFHNSTYTFGVVVAVFLAGLAIGAALVAVVGQRVSQRSLIAAGCVFGAVAVAGSVVVFVRWTGFDYFTAGDGFAAYFVGAIWLVAVVVLPPTILLGMTLPALFTTQSGRTLGSLAAANTAGSVAGALAAGFLFVPTLGLWATFALFVILFGFAGVVLLLRLRGAAWGVTVTTSLAVVLAAVIVESAPAQGTHGQQEELVRRWESAYGWIDVTRTTKTGALRVRQNLHYRHGSTTNAIREYRQGRLPLLMHARPTEVAFLGLGTGLTAAPIIADREVRNAVVVELIPEVVEAARLLSDANLGVVDHPKVQLHMGDARHFLRRTDRRFDVIVADLFVPWESRSGYLYTVEFYEAARRRLKPGGHFCQWLALYQFGQAEFELVANSFAAVFPNVTLWWGQIDGRFPIVALIGSDRDLSPEHLNNRLQTPASFGGHDPELASPSDLAGLYLGRWLPNPSRQLNTDEHPFLEFTAPLNQQSGRRLSGQPLLLYFDEVLAELPEGGIRFMELTAADWASRRWKQRLGLFGSKTP